MVKASYYQQSSLIVLGGWSYYWPQWRVELWNTIWKIYRHVNTINKNTLKSWPDAFNKKRASWPFSVLAGTYSQKLVAVIIKIIRLQEILRSFVIQKLHYQGLISKQKKEDWCHIVIQTFPKNVLHKNRQLNSSGHFQKTNHIIGIKFAENRANHVGLFMIRLFLPWHKASHLK